MNSIVCAFAKFAVYTAVIIGAPLLVESTVDFTTVELNKENVNYKAK